MTRVVFVSDVYFPRVNGVSTSIRTFRQDLSACGVDTLLVAPSYDRSATSDERAADEAGILRKLAGQKAFESARAGPFKLTMIP